MEVKKLYYEDSHLREFTATVTGCEAVKGGYAVTLNATAFYPTGGGQNCDLGILGGAHVLDVKEQGEDIIHLCDTPLEVAQKLPAPSIGQDALTTCSSTPASTW